MYIIALYLPVIKDMC